MRERISGANLGVNDTPGQPGAHAAEHRYRNRADAGIVALLPNARRQRRTRRSE
jgi:hypothetical protein